MDFGSTFTTLVGVRAVESVRYNHLQLDVPENMKRFTYSYLVNGSLAIIQEWILEKYIISSNELAQLIYSLADHSLLAFKTSDEK